jgi:2-aminoadipate transaminase
MQGETAELQAAGARAGALPFIYGHVDPTRFPIKKMQAAAAIALERYGSQALNYGAEQGCSPLLDYLRAKLARDEDTKIEPESIMLTVGASGGLDSVCRLFTQPGDTVLVEAPTYHEALMVIRDYPVNVAAVPLDEGGLIVDALAEWLKRLVADGARPRLLYTIPTFQNPSGVTLSSERRRALLELARAYGVTVVEDDVYRDLAFENNPPLSLFALSRELKGSSVIRLGSFSKILAPGLRLGWLLAAPDDLSRLTSSGLTTSGGGANPFVAYVTATFCEQGWLEPHIANLVTVYRRRRDTVLAELEKSMPPEVHWTRPGGGFYIWLTLPEPMTARQVLDRAQEQSITFLTGEPFFAQGGGERNIRLPFSFIQPNGMVQGIKSLAVIVRDLL